MDHLKLIAIVPPEPVFTEIRKEQEFIAKTWGPKHALRTPPHITIIPPIALTSGQTGWLSGMAYALAGHAVPFTFKLYDFDFFRPKVVYVRPVVSPELQELHDLWHQALLARMPHILDQYPDRPYHPHLTLAHKDVPGAQFEAMRKYYTAKTYRAEFLVDHFCILSHQGEGWVIERRYPFDQAEDRP